MIKKVNKLLTIAGLVGAGYGGFSGVMHFEAEPAQATAARMAFLLVDLSIASGCPAPGSKFRATASSNANAKSFASTVTSCNGATLANQSSVQRHGVMIGSDTDHHGIWRFVGTDAVSSGTGWDTVQSTTECEKQVTDSAGVLSESGTGNWLACFYDLQS